MNFVAAGRAAQLYSSSRLSRIIVAAALLHIALTLAVYLIGFYQILPGTFDRHGIGFSFVPDSHDYRVEASALAGMLSRGDVGGWMNSLAQLHVKLYSLSFTFFGPLLGHNVLSAEPLNVLYYLSVVTLVFKLAGEVFDDGVGIISVAVTALWPSFLIHTTQLLRDGLFIVAALTLLLVCVRWLTREYSWRRGLAAGAAAGAAVLVLRLVRREMWELVLAVVALSCALLVVRQLYERRILFGNLTGLTVLLIITVVASQVSGAFRKPNSLQARPPEAISARDNQASPPNEAATAFSTSTRGESFWSRIGRLRRRFANLYPDASANIDADVELGSAADVARYLPRALSIGLFAPFPGMWFERGQRVGRVGRLLAGFETLVMYLIELLAALCLWRERRRLPAWFLLLVAIVGVTALGLVVVNLGALYRMRYVFWMLLVILGAGGLARVLPILKLGRTQAVEGVTAPQGN